jgi:phage host-nuclease inhibitor protein Gam
MTDQLKTFTCNYCQILYNWNYLASINELSPEKTLLQREIWEKELVRLKTEQMTNDNAKVQEQLTPQINNCLQQLHYLELQLKTGKEYVCQTCQAKFQVKKEVSKFTCEVCNLENETKPYEGHIANYQFQGISPRKWSKFCQSCKDTKIIMANLYCPRVSDGYDGWDINKPQYDCDCPSNNDLIPNY